METKNNEENGVLRERFALAMERIGEIAGEATVPEAYQPYFRRTAGFILTMEVHICHVLALLCTDIMENSIAVLHSLFSCLVYHLSTDNTIIFF